MTSEQYMLLYEKYIAGLCTPEEECLLLDYQDKIKFLDDQDPSISVADKETRRRIYSNIVQTTKEIPDAETSFPPSGILKLFRRLTVAAAILIIVGVGVLLFRKHAENPGHKNETVKAEIKPIKPGTNTAVLTLSDGSSIVLDDVANGTVAHSGNTSIKKLKNGLLAYDENGKNIHADPNVLNTISIPRGGKYTVTLPDGTSVSLNSESSLTYPVTFNGKERKVILKGEAYFDVVRNKNMPFVVHTDDIDVKVLGTQFNVNAYKEESKVKTTLVEGSVRLSNQVNTTLLVPGQQGVVDKSDAGISRKNVNVNQVIAWKLGYFVFRDDNIQDIMRQIGRWYDVEVEYRGNMTNKTFGGTYSKNKDINELLKGLELTGLIHFKIEGRRIIVMT